MPVNERAVRVIFPGPSNGQTIVTARAPITEKRNCAASLMIFLRIRILLIDLVSLQDAGVYTVVALGFFGEQVFGKIRFIERFIKVAQ